MVAMEKIINTRGLWLYEHSHAAGLGLENLNTLKGDAKDMHMSFYLKIVYLSSD